MKMKLVLKFKLLNIILKTCKNFKICLLFLAPKNLSSVLLAKFTSLNLKIGDSVDGRNQ